MLKFKNGSVSVSSDDRLTGVFFESGKGCISVYFDESQGPCICLYDDTTSGKLPVVAIGGKGSGSLQLRGEDGETVLITADQLKKLLELIKNV